VVGSTSSDLNKRPSKKSTIIAVEALERCAVDVRMRTSRTSITMPTARHTQRPVALFSFFSARGGADRSTLANPGGDFNIAAELFIATQNEVLLIHVAHPVLPWLLHGIHVQHLFTNILRS